MHMGVLKYLLRILYIKYMVLKQMLLLIIISQLLYHSLIHKRSVMYDPVGNTEIVEKEFM